MNAKLVKEYTENGRRYVVVGPRIADGSNVVHAFIASDGQAVGHFGSRYYPAYVLNPTTDVAKLALRLLGR